MTTQIFDGRIAIVTGASSGIGRATVELLAKRGAYVTAFARNAGKLAGIEGERVHAVAGSVEEPNDIERLFHETESRFGDCGILINNAGTIAPHRIDRIPVAEWDRVFAVNVRGAFLACQRAMPSMIAKREGSIVNVASISGVIGAEKFPAMTSYNASKAALIAFTEALAVEVKDKGIRVNCVSPGSVDTAMWAEVSGGAPADMTAAEVAETILFLASPQSRPMNGQNVHVFSA